MRCSRLLLAAILFFLIVSPAMAEELPEGNPLPPEKAEVIYDTLLSPRTMNGLPYGSQQIAPAEIARAKINPLGITGGNATDIFRKWGIMLEGKPEQGHFFYTGMQMFLVIDSKTDRLRLMTPLARLDELRRDPDFAEVMLLQKMLKANYLATGEARICLNRNILWTVFSHPLDTLAERDLLNAIEQLANVARKTRGSAR
jgi:hypothetical protein